MLGESFPKLDGKELEDQKNGEDGMKDLHLFEKALAAKMGR